eukprot:284396-Pyramimonas_sp.AAC.1
MLEMISGLRSLDPEPPRAVAALTGEEEPPSAATVELVEKLSDQMRLFQVRARVIRQKRATVMYNSNVQQ